MRPRFAGGGSAASESSLTLTGYYLTARRARQSLGERNFAVSLGAAPPPRQARWRSHDIT